VGSEVLRAVVMKNSTFWSLAFTLISCLAYSSTMKMEETFSSETLVDFQRTTGHYVLEGRTPRDMLSFKQELNCKI
jgi:hypothetical protein